MVADLNLICENISIFYMGSEHCLPGHCHSTGFYDRYLIHYIVSGKGKFICDGKTYYLHSGNAFLIAGEKGGYYEADHEDPWYYIWFNISGNMANNFLKSTGLSRQNPIYTTNNPQKITSHLEYLIKNQSENNEFLNCGTMLSILGDMIKYNANEIDNTKKTNIDYVNMCKNYIHMNYFKKIRVEGLCKFVKIEHSYLYRLFISELGQSPMDYILDYKLKRAEKLLTTTELSISDISSAIGYDDRFAFSKMFSKKYGLSPLKYRNKFKTGT